MKWSSSPTVTPISETAQGCCLQRADWMWAADDVIIAGVHQRQIPTDAIDRIPPWRAAPYVTAAIAAGGHLEHGTLDLLTAAADAAGQHARAGWWRAALGLPPSQLMTDQVAATIDGYVPPPGWMVVRTEPAG